MSTCISNWVILGIFNLIWFIVRVRDVPINCGELLHNFMMSHLAELQYTWNYMANILLNEFCKLIVSIHHPVMFQISDTLDNYWCLIYVNHETWWNDKSVDYYENPGVLILEFCLSLIITSVSLYIPINCNLAECVKHKEVMIWFALDCVGIWDIWFRTGALMP